jgi:PKD repeat protein
MTGYGFTYRPDDHGNTAASPTPLVVTNSTSVSGSGIVERTDDRDCFSFMTGTGTITLNVAGAARSTNLDVKAELFDSGNVLVASANPSSSLNASLANVSVAAGTYTLVIDGVGNGDLVTGYSDYGSLGAYTIAGTIVNPGVVQPPVAVATASATSGSAPLSVQFTGSTSYDPDGSIATYAWDFGDGSAGDATADPSHTYLNKGTFVAVLTVVDKSNWTDTASVVITVIDVPSAPGGLTAAAVSSSQINLAWGDQSNDETAFIIDRSTDGTAWTELARVGSNVSSYANTGLTADRTYYYRVKAGNGAGESGYSNVISATTQTAPAMHVGDLDGSRSVTKKSWSAKVTILVQDAAERPVSGSVVSGAWNSTAAASCTTGTAGTCTVTAAKLTPGTPSVTFTVGNVVKSGSTYRPAANHDLDGGSNGTAITITK